MVRDFKTVFVEQADGDLSRVTIDEAQRRINDGLADLLKFDVKIRRIRMVSRPKMHVKGDSQITQRVRRVEARFEHCCSLNRGVSKPADPWTLDTMPVDEDGTPLILPDSACLNNACLRGFAL